MMKFIFMVIFMFMLLSLMKKKMFFIYQNFILLVMFLMMIDYPLNNMNYWIKIYYVISGDFYSMILIYLTLWIMFLMMMIKKNFFLNFYYIFIMNFLLLFLMLCFMTFNLMLFYMYFEMSLIPVFLLILGWGLQIDRIQAGFYMMMYTLLGSMPLFIMILYINQKSFTLMMEFVQLNFLSWYMYMLLMMAFLIKMPLYLVHLWLPKAHVEAPLSGSMILAGVMLKLGSYGLMRLLLMLMDLMMNYNKFILMISMMGGIYSSFICLNQMDMKKLVAYSSVVHMSILLAGLLTLNNWGVSGSIMMMMAHGLCSSGLFCLVNINYERVYSRSMLINNGMINIFPSLSLMWFLLCSSNLSFPPSLNLWSEIMLINSLIIWEKKNLFLLFILMFFSACYSLYLYSFSQFGLINMKMYFYNITINEFINLIFHWFPLNILFIYMYMFI
uniref:NADH-ubiquinone oxidoreductase chain 4 n=1 Tax=Amblyjoppa sp. ZJUH_2016002 TaxID=2491150 RepID=A0A3S8V072_9HYME|nr:NADH dehydrogenase subunit 4 [Amblyjoppa sp. ZJUH_2016002]